MARRGLRFCGFWSVRPEPAARWTLPAPPQGLIFVSVSLSVRSRTGVLCSGRAPFRNRLRRGMSVLCRQMILLVVFLCVLPRVSATERMNLLIVETDEHHFRTLGCYGGQIVETPNIDWIAKHGAMCTGFYATTPVCSPSRAALVSGQYPQKTAVTANDIPLDDAVVTFAEVLRQNGYATGYAGKWHLDGTGKPQWAPKRNFGFVDNRYMFNRGHWKKLVDTPEGPRVGATNRKGQPGYGLDGADESTYTTDYLCNKASEFIRAHKSDPFCYMVSLPDPHGPNTVRPPYDTMFEDVEVPIPSTLTRRPEQIPAWGKPQNVRPAQLRNLMRQYYGMVKCIDDNVGKLLSTLKEEGLLDRTLIVFTADHGDLCGEHGRLNKGVPYEGSARVPFLMYCPGSITPGTRIDAALSNVDFFPTVMSLLQVRHQQPVDGRDASALFRGQPPDSWDDFTIVRSAGKPNSAGPAWLSVITSRWKLVYATNDKPWLIDLENDPKELTNLFADPRHKPTIQRLTRHLVAYGQQHNDPWIGLPGIRQWVGQVAGDQAALDLRRPDKSPSPPITDPHRQRSSPRS